MLDDYGTSEKFWAEAINTACVMHPTECITTDSSRKLHMISSPGRNQIYPTFESLVANASSIRRKGLVCLRVDEGFFLGYASKSKAYRVFNQTSGLVEETCDVEFDESNGSQEEVIGYDNVGDEEIEEALKKMSIGDIKPEEVHEGNDQGGGPSSCTPSTSTAPQVDEDQEKDDPLPQENVPTPTPQVQEQEEQSVPQQAQVHKIHPNKHLRKYR